LETEIGRPRITLMTLIRSGFAGSFFDRLP
jgi:hypothetical protein